MRGTSAQPVLLCPENLTGGCSHLLHLLCTYSCVAGTMELRRGVTSLALSVLGEQKISVTTTTAGCRIWEGQITSHISTRRCWRHRCFDPLNELNEMYQYIFCDDYAYHFHNPDFCKCKGLKQLIYSILP